MAAVLAAGVLAAGAGAAQPPPGLGGRWTWQGTQMNDGATFAPDDPSRYTLELLPDGRVAVQVDCNRGTGSYTLDGNRLTIGPLAMTRAACPAGSLGDTFARQLGAVASYALRGPDLYLELAVDSGAMRFVAAGGGGQTTEGAAMPQLEGTAWTLVEYAGPDGAARPVLAGTEIWARFEGGRLGGSAGCNSYGSSYTVTGSTLALTGPTSTLRLCAAPAGIMEQEAAYLAALRRVAGFELAPDALVLRDTGGALLLRFAPQAQTPLEGTTWQAQAYNNGRGGVVSLVAGTEITARFADGRVTGSAGCNRYTAPYTLAGATLQLGAPAATTRRLCRTPPGRMEQERAYLAALLTAQTYRIEGNRLLLLTADGARVASFVPAH
jgi:heat shock protein HslJ